MEPYLCVGGQEVANPMRTLTYLRRGLGPREWEVPLRDPFLAEGSGYRDDYVDVYELDAYSAQNLACWCAAIDEGVYVDPETDEAPWFVSSRPDSADFLGVLARSVILDPVLVRPVTPRRGLGSRVGPLRARHRTLAFEGLMVAASAEGMAYGERWLTDVLAGFLCSDDETMEATVLPACPSLVDDDEAFRRLAEVGVIDGPAFSDVDGAKSCHVRAVAFQLAAGVPHLLGEPVACVDTEPLAPAGAAAGCLVEAPEWVGDVAVVVTIEALTALTDVEVTATPLHPDQTECPVPGSPSPAIRYAFPSIAVGDVVTIDATRHGMWLDNATTKRRESAVPLLDMDGPVAWIEVPACSRVCVAVSGDGVGTVTVETVTREL